MSRSFILIAVFSACLSAFGCTQIERHKVLTTIFEGVPSLPPPEEICQDYAEKRLVAFQAEASGKKAGSDSKGSVHPPYEEKKCDDCHDKSKEGGTVLPKNELCFKCHKNFLTGSYAHGPAAVGDCLACHVPHSSTFVKLLKVEKGKLCITCHKEKRLADEMHNKVGAHQMVCADCHDPHSGSSPYFLK